MWSQLKTVATLALSSLAAVEAATADRSFSDLTRAQHDIRAAMLQQQRLDIQSAQASNSTSGWRFLSPNTKKYVVNKIPEIPYDIGETYAGNIPINSSDPSRTLFFLFQPTVGAPVDEVTIWLQGGPGCASTSGWLQENGRFVWQPGMYTVQKNPYSWVNLTNMLWVDQPVGTGYTTGKVTAKSSFDVARDFANWFKNFQQTFGIKKFKIYVTGESYAGRWVPYVSAEILNRKKTDPDYFDLNGALVYDPVIGAFTYTQEQVTMAQQVQNNQQLFNLDNKTMSTLLAADKSCGYEAIRNKYLQFPPPGNQPVAPSVSDACDQFDLVNNAVLRNNPCFNIYGINQACPLLGDVIGFPTELTYFPNNDVNYDAYFNRSDVKAALHAPQNINWAECSGPVFVSSANGGSPGPEGYGDNSPDPIQHVLPQVVEGTNRVLVGNGDYDMIIQTNGTLLAIQNMTWNGKLGFQSRPNTPIDIKLPDLQYQAVFQENGITGLPPGQGIMGIQHYERGLMWVETFQSGHMQPQDQPRSSYRHLSWLLNRTQTI